MIGMHWLKLMIVVCRGRYHLEMIQTGQKFLESRILEFWNKRKVNAFKTKQDYHFMLGDHKNEVLSDVIVTTDGDEVPLTAMSYIEIHKLTRPRIFFLTKLKSIARRIADMIEVNNSDSDFEDPKFPY